MTNDNGIQNDADSNRNNSTNEANGKVSSVVTKEKKSKRQLKRERREEEKSALRLCPEVAKTGAVGSCLYGDRQLQKPADLEGECPFLSAEGQCPYGLACRFYGTHKQGLEVNRLNVGRRSSESNGLTKVVQKLLWKYKMKFPKTDSVLKSLGLLEPGKWKVKKLDEEEVDWTFVADSHVANEHGSSEMVSDPTDNLECSVEVPVEDANETITAHELCPSKKAKSVTDQGCCSREEFDEVVIDNVLRETEGSLTLHPCEKRLINFRGKLYLAPLTTVGNLPFRWVCKVLGADVTCGEMAMCTNLLQGQASEWALPRRHLSEDLFGVQICGAYPDTVARTVELMDQECIVDFIDINMCSPIDIVVNKGAGSCLLTKPMRMKGIIQAASSTVEIPLTVKILATGEPMLVTIHGRSRQQCYSKLADWHYIYQRAKKAPESLQVIGNGDIFSYADWNKHMSNCPELSSCMLARGALIKPWIFTEIKEQRHWDITSGERLNIMKEYVRFGLEHWGSDSKGVETTRHFLLEWLSYTCRYIPIGLF